MAGGEHFASSDGPGGRASRFLDAVVAFVVAIFHPIFRVFASADNTPPNSTSQPSQPPQPPPPQPAIENHNNVHPIQRDDGDTERMRPPQKSQSAATPPSPPSQSLREVNANAINPPPTTTVKVTLPQIGPSNGSVKQENMATKTATADPTNGAKFRSVGEEQAEENRQEQLTLPPPIQSVDAKAGGDEEDPAVAAERAIHHGFMNQALDMARLSLRTNETPVGCVLVHNGRVIAKGMNATNITRNGTRHAELMALTALLSYTPKTDMEPEKPKKPKRKSKNKRPDSQQSDQTSIKAYTDEDWGDVDPSDGHIYPYGQKLHPAPRVDRQTIQESILYVTVEPCVMCASMLRQFGIKKVYFGAVNDKFGGTGGVFCIHMNSDPATHAATAPATPAHRPVSNQIPRPTIIHKPASCASSINGSQDGPVANGGDVKSVNGIVFVEPPIPVSNTSIGHGGNVEDGFEAEGGWGRDEAVNLLRQFYVQENGRAPVPRKKEGRAARLAAMMESKGMSTEGTALEGLLQQEREAMSGENAGAEDADAGSLAAAVEAELKVQSETGEEEHPSTGAAADAQPTEAPVREWVPA